MTSQKNEAINFTNALHRSMIAIGINHLIRYLNLISEVHNKSKIEIAEAIMDVVCSHFDISKEELIKSQRNDGNRHDALCILSLLLKKHLLFSQNEVAVFLNKHKSQVSKYISKMTHLNPTKVEVDRKLDSEFKALETIVLHILSNKD